MSKMPYAHYQPVFPTNGIILVGVCAAGKSTISRLLTSYGMVARSIAQEHSQVPTLFSRQGDHPVVLLSASFSSVRQRRRLAWTFHHYEEQWKRLQLARQKANLIIRTDALDPQSVAQAIVEWFDQWTGLSTFFKQRHILDAAQQTMMRYQVTWGIALPNLMISPAPELRRHSHVLSRNRLMIQQRTS